ncbi:MAG: M14 family metallopeptidase [Gemmataceae bacterium]
MKSSLCFLLPVLFALLGSAPLTAQQDSVDDELITVAEQSNYRETARSATVVRFLDRVSQRAKHIHKFTFGKTHKGQPMVGAVIASPPVTSPKQLKNDKRLVVLVIGNIHSGECCGQEALMRMLRELLGRPDHLWMRELVLLFVPNYNADGNDVRAKDNRPGQVGPVGGMGRRANAQGFDLNRDYVKLESPEARALITLMNQWDPACFIDCHTTNGSWHRYALTYDVPHNPAADIELRKWMRGTMMPAVTRNLLKNNIDTFYYGNFDRKMSRWTTYGHEPRYGLDYFGLRGRLSILSEAYSYITFQERIEATHGLVTECLNILAKNAKTVRTKLRAARRRVIAAGENPQPNDLVPIRAAIARFPNKYIVKGFDPPWQPRILRKDIVPGVRPTPPGKPKDYRVDFYGKFEAVRSVRRPYAYLVPKNLKTIVAKLRQHGIQIEKLKEGTRLTVEVYEWQAFRRAKMAFQNHRIAKAAVTSHKDRRKIPAGTFVVRTAQPLGTLLVYLLEPESDDGLVTWNYFDAYAKIGEEFPILRVRNKVPLSTRS